MERGAWQSAVLGVTKESDMTEQLNNKIHMLLAQGTKRNAKRMEFLTA